ncbi:MAG TPA: hypothetical protein VMR41_03400 [Patescibacteria group bacterium]|nr:hypothetical protein [Patescibacteria group bacterium]
MNLKFSPRFFTIFLFISLSGLFGQILPVFAQSMSSGIAYSIDIADKNVKPGNIISFSNSNYHLSKIEYDPSAYAVVTDNPALALENQTASPLTYSVVSSGHAYVLVSSKNGKIKTGDLITASSTPGVGEKVTDNGYVIGTALESYDVSNTKQAGLILVNLNFGYYTSTSDTKANLVLTVKQAFSGAYLSPSTAIRYVLASLIILVFFGFGLGFFGRVITTGVEALGRNPLASRVIMFSIIINFVLLLAAMGVGIIIAYLILVF